MGKEDKFKIKHLEVLSTAQKTVLKKLGPLMKQWHFYLGGGTAIAIYLGHRHSVDLDWFTEKGIGDPMRLAQDIRNQGITFVTGQIERGTLHGTISGIRVSFLEYRYPLLKPLVFKPQFTSQIASLEDLACMKLSAIAQRGSKKDFVDLYALGMKDIPLKNMVRFYKQKYSVEDVAHVIYGLSYFDDADKERMPKMFWNTGWRTIKNTIQGWVREIGRV